MLLALDVGNTNIVIGLFNDDELVTNWRLEADKNKSADEYGMLINQLIGYEGYKMEDITDVVISTVVPSVLYTLQHLAVKYFNTKPIVVDYEVKSGISIDYDEPNKVGADRIVNAAAALKKYGGPLIIIDCGTATTFCAVSENAEFLGGSIAPGLKISLEALVEKTSLLPKVELEAPENVICKNTVNSMQSGLVYGHMGIIEYIIKKMKAELSELTKSGKPVKVVATGGLADLMQSGVDCIDYVDKLLTLEGLKIIHELNKT